MAMLSSVHNRINVHCLCVEKEKKGIGPKIFENIILNVQIRSSSTWRRGTAVIASASITEARVFESMLQITVFKLQCYCQGYVLKWKMILSEKDRLLESNLC
jgi:hypothetical protein